MTKRIWIAAAFALFALTVQAQNANGFETSAANGTVTITGYTGSAKELVIPAAINGLPVTKIGERAFIGCSSLMNVTIPSSVTEIGYSAFSGCSSLMNVTIPPSVTEIGWWAFAGCNLNQATRSEITRRFGDAPLKLPDRSPSPSF